jgi:REP element-mobilizing transposase RayT
MARPLRIEYDGALYHVTSRGNERKRIFQDDTDRELFLNTLSRVNERFNWICHAYCLMANHYHLVIETPDGNLSKGMRQLNGVYTQAYNRRHHRKSKGKDLTLLGCFGRGLHCRVRRIRSAQRRVSRYSLRISIAPGVATVASFISSTSVAHCSAVRSRDLLCAVALPNHR